MAQTFELDKEEVTLDASIAGHLHPIHVGLSESHFTNINILGRDFCQLRPGGTIRVRRQHISLAGISRVFHLGYEGMSDLRKINGGENICRYILIWNSALAMHPIFAAVQRFCDFSLRSCVPTI